MNRFILLPFALRVWRALRRFFQLLWLVFMLRGQAAYIGRKAIVPTENNGFRCQPKPEWVHKEVIRLKAFMPHDGCRKIAETFNRLYQHKKQMTVGKTFVYDAIKKHRYEIQVLRREIKHQKPRPLPKNLIWSLDLTQVCDDEKRLHTLFGLVDSGTRACLHLQTIRTKASIMLLRCLLDAMERYGKPKTVRTDNEPVFTSRLFRLGLWLIGIKHQRTEVCCPFMADRHQTSTHGSVLSLAEWQSGALFRHLERQTEKLRHREYRNTGRRFGIVPVVV